jgi:hypothetical protein
MRDDWEDWCDDRSRVITQRYRQNGRSLALSADLSW